MICWKCKKEIEILQVYRTTECPMCHADLHVCKGCKYYSSGSHYDCKETVDTPVTDKEKSNFCDYFRVNDSLTAGGNGAAEDKAKAAKDAFNALFS